MGEWHFIFFGITTKYIVRAYSGEYEGGENIGEELILYLILSYSLKHIHEELIFIFHKYLSHQIFNHNSGIYFPFKITIRISDGSGQGFKDS